MANNTLTCNTDKTNYARLGHATQNLMPKFFHELLLFHENPSEIVNTCYKNKRLRRRLKQDDISKLRDAAANKTFAGFDISLIYTILRNLHDKIFCPSRGWDHPDGPLPNQISLGDDVERCRRIRNKIMHRGNTSVSDQELDDFFDNFRGIAQRLETALQKTNNEFVILVDDLKTCGMDEETEKQYLQEIQELKQDRAKHIEALNSMKLERKEKQKEISKLREQLMDAEKDKSKVKVESWHEDDEDDGLCDINDEIWHDEDDQSLDEYDTWEDDYDQNDDIDDQRDDDYDLWDDDYDQMDADYDTRDDYYDPGDDEYDLS